MLSPELIRQVKRLSLKAGHLVTDALAGNYSSAFKGRGMEFDEVREYVPGDDVRRIDWNVTARMRTPFVKVLKEERELTLMLLVDVSQSQVFGTKGRTKAEVATELAAVLAFLAIKSNDKVGLIVFSDHVEAFVPPKKGRGHVWNIIRTVLTHEPRGTRTELGKALDFLMTVTTRRTTCFLISDFWTKGYEKSLNLVGRRHDLVCLHVDDPRERTLESCGVVAFEDAESGETVELDTGDPRVLKAFAVDQARRAEHLKMAAAKARCGLVRVGTDQPVVAPLVRYFRERERRKIR